MPDLNTEYVHDIKLKVEKLLKLLIAEYRIEELISIKYRYRIDLSDMSTESNFYKLYENHCNCNGEHYIYGKDYIHDNFIDRLTSNFPDYMVSQTIYDSICNTGYITKDDLLKLNEIHKKHHQMVA